MRERAPEPSTNHWGREHSYRGDQDAYFNLHGGTRRTGHDRRPEELSSGCIRLFNQDIMDLYNRVAARR